jgi:hypothetical protein
MTPPPIHRCEGCFLQEQREGSVCPGARDAYGLADVQAERNSEALRAAIQLDAYSYPSLAQLVRIDAAQAARDAQLGGASLLVIDAAPAGLLPVAATDEEVICVPSEK